MPFVAMVMTADFRDLNHRSPIRWLHRRRLRCGPVQRQVPGAEPQGSRNQREPPQNHQGHGWEVDSLVLEDGRPWMLVECKTGTGRRVCSAWSGVAIENGGRP